MDVAQGAESAAGPASLGGFAAWAAESVWPILSLLAAAWYAVVWVCDYAFYARLGTSPGEVGLDETTMIVQTLPYFVSFAVAVPGLILLLIINGVMLSQLAVTLGDAARGILRGKRSETRPARQARPAAPPEGVLVRNRVAFAVGSAVALVVGFFAIGFAEATTLAGRAKAGESIQSYFVSGLIPHPFRFRAELSDVYWHAGDGCGAKLGTLLYLGQSDGTSVLYDYERGQTRRVPSGSIVLLTPPSAGAACESGSAAAPVSSAPVRMGPGRRGRRSAPE